MCARAGSAMATHASMIEHGRRSASGPQNQKTRRLGLDWLDGLRNLLLTPLPARLLAKRKLRLLDAPLPLPVAHARVKGKVQIGLDGCRGEQVAQAAHDSRGGGHLMRRRVADAVPLRRDQHDRRAAEWRLERHPVAA